MKNFIKYIWKHFVKQEHNPEFYLNDDEAKCYCGRRIYKTRKGEWVE